jgi:hypothetical protein
MQTGNSQLPVYFWNKDAAAGVVNEGKLDVTCRDCVLLHIMFSKFLFGMIVCTLRTLGFVILLVIFVRHAHAGPPFVTDDPEPVEYRHWEFYLSSGWEFQKSAANGTLPHVEINYGAVPDVQVHVIAPLGYSRADRLTHYGYGDTEFGVKYRFIHETARVPQIGIFPLLEIPTGNARQNLGSGETQVFLPVWTQKSWGKVTTYGGAGYWLNSGTGNKNWLLAGWELQYDFSEALTLGGEILGHTADHENSTAGSGFNIGGILNLSAHDHVLVSAGHSLSGEETTTLYVALQWTR